MAESVRPTPDHIGLLRVFRKNPRLRDLEETDVERFWVATCAQAKLAPVTYADVVEALRKMKVGENQGTRLALAPVESGRSTCVGVSLNGRLQASHTVQTRTLLLKALRVYAGSFTNLHAFLEEIREMTTEIGTERMAQIRAAASAPAGGTPR